MLTRSDLDQCVRYLNSARTLLAATSFAGKSAGLSVIDMAIARLGPGESPTDGDIAAAVTSLTGVAIELPAGDLRVTLNKGIAVLRDRASGSRYRA